MTIRTYSGPRLRRLGERVSASASRTPRPGALPARGGAWLQLSDLLQDVSSLDQRERHVRERITENARAVLPLLGQQRDEVLRQVDAAQQQRGATSDIALVLALADRATEPEP